MEDLFANNLIAIYIIAAISVISYTNFKENQRMVLLYLFTCSTVYFDIFGIKTALFLLFVITFAFLEYLSEDEKKMALFVQLKDKIIDYCFMMVMQYNCILVLISLAFFWMTKIDQLNEWKNAFWMLSVITLCLAVQRTTAQPFKIKSIAEMYNVFDVFPMYNYQHTEEIQRRLDLLAAFEDRTYFQRKKAYTVCSWEFIKNTLHNHQIYSFVDAIQVLFSIKRKKEQEKSWRPKFAKRGYSNPEMQLIRTIGVLRGYDKYKITRKIFEVLYSHIFFGSLKKYHEANSYLPLHNYRQYLLFVYCQTVVTRINKTRIFPLASAFENTKDVGNWSMEACFVAFLGLNFRTVNNSNLHLYEDIIEEFGLDKEEIVRINSEFPTKKLPLKSENTEKELLTI